MDAGCVIIELIGLLNINGFSFGTWLPSSLAWSLWYYKYHQFILCFKTKFKIFLRIVSSDGNYFTADFFNFNGRHILKWVWKKI